MPNPGRDNLPERNARTKKFLEEEAKRNRSRHDPKLKQKAVGIMGDYSAKTDNGHGR
jgi:hypothetical protein